MVSSKETNKKIHKQTSFPKIKANLYEKVLKIREEGPQH
jgi:hypothetical protein